MVAPDNVAHVCRSPAVMVEMPERPDTATGVAVVV
jgi:hypothetical protein